MFPNKYQSDFAVQVTSNVMGFYLLCKKFIEKAIKSTLLLKHASFLKIKAPVKTKIEFLNLEFQVTRTKIEFLNLEEFNTEREVSKIVPKEITLIIF